MKKKLNVYVDGVFDLFHEGHVNLLREAKSFGNLTVGVHSDAFTAGYKRIPFINEKTRYEVVRSCRYVDCVLEDATYLTHEQLDNFKIDIVFHGDDFNWDQILMFYKPAVDRGIFRYLPYTKEVFSSKLIRKIDERYGKEFC